MRAAVLQHIATPLVIDDVPEPTRGTGEVIVEVVASQVLSYMGDVLSGKRQYLFSTPMIPGASCVGRVVSVGLDAPELVPGQWVYCDPTVRARDNAVSPRIVLQGLTAGDEGGLSLQKYVPDGSWAQRVRIPTENAIPLGSIDAESAPTWATLGNYLVPYGGFTAAALLAGEVVLLNGATGTFGSAGVAVALALGASCVLATGRNKATLDELSRRFGPRVRPVAMATDEARDRDAILAAAPGPIDCVLDLLPPEASAAQVRAALRTVRPHGRVVWMGGVREDVAVPYTWLMRNCVTLLGQFMYTRDSITRLIALVHSGQLRLDDRQLTRFRLEQANEAIAHAAATSGPFNATLLCV
jgi:alcohol dehydrogenase